MLLMAIFLDYVGVLFIKQIIIPIHIYLIFINHSFIFIHLYIN